MKFHEKFFAYFLITILFAGCTGWFTMWIGLMINPLYSAFVVVLVFSAASKLTDDEYPLLLVTAPLLILMWVIGGMYPAMIGVPAVPTAEQNIVSSNESNLTVRPECTSLVGCDDMTVIVVNSGAEFSNDIDANAHPAPAPSPTPRNPHDVNACTEFVAAGVRWAIEKSDTGVEYIVAIGAAAEPTPLYCNLWLNQSLWSVIDDQLYRPDGTLHLLPEGNYDG